MMRRKGKKRPTIKELSTPETVQHPESEEQLGNRRAKDS
jgi:hypothetical protein